MSSKSKSKTHLGRALFKQRFSKTQNKLNEDNLLHVADLEDGQDWNRINLKSVTEENNFQEFLNTAQQAEEEYQNEKMNIVFVNPLLDLENISEELSQDQKDNFDKLKVPRRPAWNKNMTTEELNKQEYDEFLNWRRNLAILEDEKNILVTPYEKNLEFWKQLWRVIERSDVVVQIVDARNPLLFRCEDLEKYVKEVSQEKVNVILVNKSDLLTGRQRRHWLNYFKEINVNVLFYSALESSQIMPIDEELSKKLFLNDEDSEPILSHDQLIEKLRELHTGAKVLDNVLTVGFTGYPNVGKSSTINTLLREKKVSVSATPGKTKHFQTFYLEKDFLLCDCPGLVMPSFVSTKAEMILNGILPVDQMRDHVSPMNLLLKRIPKHVLEDMYGVMIPVKDEEQRKPQSAELLNAYAFNRGFMTANGQPDNARAARIVIKDYINGKILFPVAPPNLDQNVYHTYAEAKKVRNLENRTKRQILSSKGYTQDASEFDGYYKSEFDDYYKKSTGFHVKAPVFSTNEVKYIWQLDKKHKRKKEKARRVYAHLDEH